MDKLYKFCWNYKNGKLEGMFISTEEAVNNLIGKHIYFGEVLGKHSEIYGILEESDVIVITDDQLFIEEFRNKIGKSFG